MPAICEYVWSDALDLIIRQEAAAAGTPLDLAYTFIAAESGFDPTAHALTATEDSVGLLQLNRMGGQGAGYSVAELMDPRRNLQIGLPYITAAHQATWSPTIAPFEFIYLVSIRSGHPGPVERNDARILKIARIWSCFFPAAGIIGPDGAPGATTNQPGPAFTLADAVFTGLFAPFMLVGAAAQVVNLGRHLLDLNLLSGSWHSLHPSTYLNQLDPFRGYRHLGAFFRPPLPPARRPPRHPRAGRRPGG